MDQQDNQPKVYETAMRLGLDVAEQYTDGDEICQLGDGTILRSTPDSSGADKLEDLDRLLCDVIDNNSEDVDIHHVSHFPVGLDDTLSVWASTKGVVEDVNKDSLSSFSAAVVGREADEIGMHYFLDYIKSGGGFVSIATEGTLGAQSLKIKQGTSAIAQGLANGLQPGSVTCNSLVDSIRQTSTGLQVKTSTGIAIHCRKVIVAIPTNTYKYINFSPPLPHEKNALVSHTKPGQYAKMVLTYTKPWWRELGMSGKFTSFMGPICFSWDVSDLSEKQYSLAVFIAGRKATRWAQLNTSRREEAVINHLTTLVGPSHVDLAKDVLEINCIDWSEEPHIEGAPTCSMGPGLLSSHGEALRQPFENIHFAGGETAYEWKGYLEGALRAGSRAAEEIIRCSKEQFVREPNAPVIIRKESRKDKT